MSISNLERPPDFDAYVTGLTNFRSFVQDMLKSYEADGLAEDPSYEQDIAALEKTLHKRREEHAARIQKVNHEMAESYKTKKQNFVKRFSCVMNESTKRGLDSFVPGTAKKKSCTYHYLIIHTGRSGFKSYDSRLRS